jgi:2-polyprenyl-3-methyl-5-hydroxy-6-metoxy-1,4-benzoquinol methylase
MDALKNGHFSEAFDRLAQKVSEKPGEYGFAAAAAVSITLLLAVRSSKKKVRYFVSIIYAKLPLQKLSIREYLTNCCHGDLFMVLQALARDSNDFQNTFAGSTNLLSNSDSVLQRDEVKNAIDGYEELFSGARKSTGAITDAESIAKRQNEYQKMVNSFYNLVTDFYEWGWGQSFHFGPRFKGETFVESIKRCEYHLCSRLGMKPGMKVVDVGCGVGGPMRNMCQFSGSTIDGLTLNQYQVTVGNKYNAQKGLAHLCKLVQGDFQAPPFESGTYDAAYAIEATCHSPDKVRLGAI